MMQVFYPHHFHFNHDEEEQSTEVRGTSPLGCLFIIDVGSTTSTANDQAVVISGKDAKILILGSERVMSNAKLMAQVIMSGLC